MAQNAQVILFSQDATTRQREIIGVFKDPTMSTGHQVLLCPISSADLDTHDMTAGNIAAMTVKSIWITCGRKSPICVQALGPEAH